MAASWIQCAKSVFYSNHFTLNSYFTYFAIFNMIFTNINFFDKNFLPSTLIFTSKKLSKLGYSTVQHKLPFLSFLGLYGISLYLELQQSRNLSCHCWKDMYIHAQSTVILVSKFSSLTESNRSAYSIRNQLLGLPDLPT